MKNIIVAGFPKSGSTWITRLTAEIVGCPVEGFWNSNHDEIAIEGKDRDSDYRCFKAHQLFQDLGINSKKDKVIYVIRDPRDIFVSALHFFDIKKYSYFEKLILKIPFAGNKQKNRYINNLKRRYFLRMIFKGDGNIHKWLSVSWKAHYSSYKTAENVLFVKYEDVLSSPVDSLHLILNFLELNRSKVEILKAIENQASEKRKKEFLDSGDLNNYKFIRTAKAGSWKGELTKSEKILFQKRLKSDFYSFEG